MRNYDHLLATLFPNYAKQVINILQGYLVYANLIFTSFMFPIPGETIKMNLNTNRRLRNSIYLFLSIVYPDKQVRAILNCYLHRPKIISYFISCLFFLLFTKLLVYPSFCIKKYNTKPFYFSCNLKKAV